MEFMLFPWPVVMDINISRFQQLELLFSKGVFFEKKIVIVILACVPIVKTDRF